MAINYLKNKKYHILVSLFCLCYALGAQKVAAQDYDLKYSWNDNSPSYTISHDDFKDTQIQEVYNHSDRNIAVFVGQPTDEFYTDTTYTIFISPTAISKKSSTIKVRGYNVAIDSRKKLDKNSQAILKAYSEIYIDETRHLSFIFRLKDLGLTFYYTIDQKLRVVTKTDENVYTEKEPSCSGKRYQFILDKEEQGVKEIVQTKLIKDSKQTSNWNTKGWQFNIPSLNNKYPALTGPRIIVSCILLLALVYATFHKAINKKVT